MAKQRGKLIVISGPSGAGKSTVVFKALEGRNDICFSVSATTRKPRPGEVDGKEYFFVDLDKFREMVENDEFLEHAEYVANSYGTPKAYVEKKLSEGMNVLLDIEVQGALQVHQKMPEARLIRAKEEYAAADFYDYIIINDDADKAAKEFSAIITAEYCKYDLRKNYLSEVD